MLPLKFEVDYGLGSLDEPKNINLHNARLV